MPSTDSLPQSAKHTLRELLDAQPDDASYEDILRELAFGHMVERGLSDARAGRVHSHAKVCETVRQWRS